QIDDVGSAGGIVRPARGQRVGRVAGPGGGAGAAQQGHRRGAEAERTVAQKMSPGDVECVIGAGVHRWVTWVGAGGRGSAHYSTTLASDSNQMGSRDAERQRSGARSARNRKRATLPLTP